jgi:alanine racemase
MHTDELSTWLEINLCAIRNNIQILGRISGKPVMAVVKANAYGHGLIEVGRAAELAGAGWLGIARLEEAVLLREGGVSCPLLVLGYTSRLRVAEAIQYRVNLAVYDPDLVQQYGQAARDAGELLKVHAKFDCGMGRLGLFPEQGLDFIRQVSSTPGLTLEGMFTHFPRADETDRLPTIHAISRFQMLVEAAQSAGMRPSWVHAANSATTIYFPEARFDLVRCGISVYGLHPSDETPLPEGFQTALTWKARLSSVKMLPPGHGVGYNRRYTTTRYERIGAVAVGYADGMRRRLGNFALVGGIRVPVVGGVCMDQMMVQLDEVPEAKAGDEVVLIGRQGEAVITAEELGLEWGTNNYEVVCGLANRVPRFYIES